MVSDDSCDNDADCEGATALMDIGGWDTDYSRFNTNRPHHRSTRLCTRDLSLLPSRDFTFFFCCIYLP